MGSSTSTTASSNSQFIRTARLLFIACLVTVAAVLGFGAHKLVSNSEQELAHRQFDSMAERSLEQARSNSFSRLDGTTHMALLCSTQFPDASTWPYVVLDGFDEVATSLLKISSGRSIGISPWVPLEQLPKWEAWAIQYIEENYGPDAGVSSFGKGVFGYDFSLNNTDKRYHDTTGESLYGSPYQLIAPLIQSVGPEDSDHFLLNAYNYPGVTFALDLLVEESERRKNNTSAVPSQLSTITRPVYRSSRGMGGPSTVHMHPIYPHNDINEIVGHVSVSFRWIEVLDNVFPSDLNGVDCVLESDGQFFTYTVVQGTVSFLGPDDLHDRSFDDQGVSIELVQAADYVKEAPTYRLWLYPNDNFSEAYSTNNPTIATVGAVCVIVFTSLMFLLYDSVVRKQFHHKQAVLDAKRSFMRFISHEVRTPLNTVCLGVELMQEELRSLLTGQIVHQTQNGNPQANDDAVAAINSEKAHDILILSEQIRSNADSAVDILNDLLNYDKIEHGQLTLELTVIPIWTLLERTVKEFSLAASAKKIDLCVGFQFEGNEIKHSVSALTLNEKALRVIGDTVRITQVVRNLISNALKFTKEGQITVTACYLAPTNKISSEPVFDEFELNGCDGRYGFIRNDQVRIDVKDSGIGMTNKQLEKLFGQGVQFNVNELQAGKGSGLGLWITKGLVEQHNGKLVASSEGLGSGSTFSCTLPIHHVPDTSLPSKLLHLKVETAKPPTSRKRDPAETIADPESTSSQVRVLIVDDADLNRKMLSRLLTNRGYSCDEAENGDDAVHLVKKAMDSGRCYDSILMDYEMPVLDGPKAVAKMRSMGCGAFVIGITGNVLPDDVAYFKNCGANSVFGKPVNVQGVISLWCEYGVI